MKAQLNKANSGIVNRVQDVLDNNMLKHYDKLFTPSTHGPPSTLLTLSSKLNHLLLGVIFIAKGLGYAVWLCEPIMDALATRMSMRNVLKSKVSDLIHTGQWRQLVLDALNFESIALTLGMDPWVDDKLVWNDATDGYLTLIRTYDFKRSKQPLVTWENWVWRSSYHPHNSILL